MHIQFIGAARTVTGSMHLLHINGKKILLDCGLFQGRRAETFERNRNFPFNPKEIDVLILSHAHIDHAGNIPNFVKQGFQGPIYATPATVDLCKLMLMDSAYIQEKDIEFVNKKNARKKLPSVEPIYRVADVQPALDLFQEISYNTSFDVIDNVKATFVDAGHILGSASVILTIKENNYEKKIGFTGDVGRPHLPILRNPEFMGDVDFLISESTYGGRLHDPVENMSERFLSVIQKTVQRGGKIIIPAFSVGRTQDIVYQIHLLMKKNLFPKNLPIYVDSPLATNATEIFRQHEECFDEEILALVKKRNDPFGFQSLTYIRDVEESKKLNERKQPCIIIAASGMCEAGRVVHHIANNIQNPDSTILFVGYQAEHTLGRKLIERNPKVQIFGEEYDLKCEIAVLNSFSAHADHNELLHYFSHFDKKKLKNIFLVHGELENAEKLSSSLKDRGFNNVTIPERLQKFEV